MKKKVKGPTKKELKSILETCDLAKQYLAIADKLMKTPDKDWKGFTTRCLDKYKKNGKTYYRLKKNQK